MVPGYASGMSRFGCCKAAAAGLILLVMMSSASAGPLDVYRWKHRLILVDFPNGDEGGKAGAELEANHAALDERDLKVIDVSAERLKDFNAVRLDAPETSAVREKFRLTGRGDKAVFVLIGKDGMEKGRQEGRLDLREWFALIDTMAMRQEEMRAQAKGRE